MINRFKALFLDRAGEPRRAGAKHSAEEFQVAAAALLVEAAHMDAQFDAHERGVILDLVRRRFDLSAAEAESLLEAAQERVVQSGGLHGFTRAVKHAFDHDERIELLEMLWAVAYADGEVHDFEANLVRRVTGLLHVSDRDSGAARKRVLERMNLPEA